MISIVINTDTRPGFDASTSVQGKQFEGTRNLDFLVESIWNKYNFFKDYPNIEIIQFIDVHEGFSDWNRIIKSCPKKMKLIISPHNEQYRGAFFPKYNDLNYIQALSMARGKYVVHFDGDMAIFGRDPNRIISDWLYLLDSDRYHYISYPSYWSPSPDEDTKWDYRWASTRFFVCKQEKLDFPEIIKCLISDEYLYGKYGDKYRRCPWFEHIIGIIAGDDKVYYPPMQYKNYMVFSWETYQSGIFSKLNQLPYDDVFAYVRQCGGISYPCDVRGVKV